MAEPEQLDRTDLYSAETEQPQGGFSLKDTLIEMGKFTLGMAVLGRVSNVGARSIYKNIVARNEAFATNISNVVGKEVIANRTLNMGSLFRGVRQTLADNPAGVFKMSTDNGTKMMEVLSAASKASIASGKAMSGAYKSMSGSSSFALRSIASVGKHLYKAAPIAAGFYGVSRALGLSESRDQPAWYNVPGHIKEIAKSTAEFAAFDVGIGGLKKLGGFAKNMASKYLSEEASPGFHAFMDKHFAITRTKDGAKAGTFLQASIRTLALFDGIREGSKKISTTVTDTFLRNWGNKAQRDSQKSNLFDFTNKAFYKTLRMDAQNAFKNGYRSRMDALRNYRSDYAHDFVSSMTDMIAKHHSVDRGTLAKEMRGGDSSRISDVLYGAGTSPLFSVRSLSMFDSLVGRMEWANTRSAKTLGRTTFGRKQALTSDIMSDTDKTHYNLMMRQLKDLQEEEFTGSAVDNLHNNFLKMSAGPNVYKRAGGGVVDYGMWNPKNLLSSFMSYINPYMQIGGLPLIKTLGMSKFLAKEGLGIYSIRADEGQTYYDTKIKNFRQVGQKDNNLGGMLIDGKLFVTAEEGWIKEADANRQKMVYSTPYARDSVLNKVNAEAIFSKHERDLLNIQSENAKEGMTAKLSNFAARWGLAMPTPLRWVAEGLNKAFGFSPMRTGAKQAVNLMLDPRSTVDAVKGDWTAMVGSLGYLGNEASSSMYRTLSHPKMMGVLGRLSRDIGTDAESRIGALKTALEGTDEEVIDIIRRREAFTSDEQLRYAVEHYDTNGASDFGETVKGLGGFKMRKRPLSRREEIGRRLLNEALGGQGLPVKDEIGTPINMASRLLHDSEAMGNLSEEERRNLKLMATQIDLFHFGYLDGSGRLAANYGEKAKEDAFKIIQRHLSSERNFLEEKLFETPMIKGVGTLGFGKASGNQLDFNELYINGLKTRDRLAFNSSPYIMKEEQGGFAAAGFAANSFIDRVMEMGNHIGLKYGMQDRKPQTLKIPQIYKGSLFGKQFTIGGGRGITLGGPLANMTKRIAQGIGVMAAAQALDTFTDINPMFNGTMLDNGIFSAVADVYVKSSMAFHKVKDLSGITSAAKYLEGLMPSSTSTIPGALIGGFMRGPLGVLPGAVINRFMDANGVTPNFDRSYEEMKETYSGRELVPVRRNRFWLFSKAPFQGDAPAYFRPHWYPRLKSQYKYTDTLYGSKSEAFLFKPWVGLGFNPIGHVIDKYHYEKKHYWDRPYPVTTPALSEVPILGKILSATIGSIPIIGKPVKLMHMDEMSHYYSMGNNNNTSVDGELSTSKMSTISESEQYAYMNKKANLNSDAALFGPNRPKDMNPYGAMTVLGEQLYNFTELAGLRGYQLESLMGGGLADERPRLSGAGDMWSARRAFWDMNMGDVFASTEFFRRFVPRDKKIWQKVNPLRNKMASWLPSQEGDYFVDFLTGDPYTKVQEGEMRLPGDAYNKLYNVNRTFPGRASSLGKPVADLIRMFTGLEANDTQDEEDILAAGTAIHRYMQDTLLRNNIGIKAETLVYDAKDDISGHIDLIMYDPYRKGGKRPLEIKTVNGKKFAGIKSPIPNHVSQLNFYLRQMQMDTGTLLYINRDDPTQIRSFDVRYNEERFRKDLQDLQYARKISAGIMAEGDGFETGTSYSWLDRMRILGDIAPYSKEFKDAQEIVALQSRENKLTESDKAEVANIKRRRKSVMRKFDLYPTRFRGRIFNPDINYELQSENTNIKSAAEYSFGERVVGAMWERGIQMNTPLNTKLWNYQSPLQHYRNTKIYGTEAAAWNKPYQDLLKPMFTKAIATDNPVDSAAAFGWIGALGLGGMGNMALPGAVFGSLYGAARLVVGNDHWIPDEVNKKREIERTFDQLKYVKNMSLYEQTGDARYQTEAQNTLWNISRSGYQVGVVQAMKSLSAFEKPYFLSWMKETNPIERENILEMVPEEVGNLLKAKWGMSYDQPKPSKYDVMLPNSDWEGLMPNDNLEDIKYKTINQEGLRANDFGLGWYDQQRRVANSQFELNPISGVEEVTSSNNVASRIKSALMRSLGNVARRPLISVSITPGGDDGVKVQLNLMRDRFNDIRSAMKAR